MTAMCTSDTSGWEYLLDFEFIKAFTCSYADAMGFLVFGLLVYGAISLSIYIRTGSVVISTILVFVLGGAVLTQVAVPATGIAVILAIGVIALVVTLAWYEFAR